MRELLFRGFHSCDGPDTIAAYGPQDGAQAAGSCWVV